MQEEERRYSEIQDLEDRYLSVSNAINELQKVYDLETRVEEKLRLDPEIQERERTLVTIETLLSEKKPPDYADFQRRVLTNRAHRFKGNSAFEQALDCWKQLYILYPEDDEIKESIKLLENKLSEQNRIVEIRKQVVRRTKDIRPIYKSVLYRLKTLDNISEDDDGILENVQMFIDGELNAEDFIENWKVLTEDATSSSTSTINYKALAGRIQRGEMILFLGSGIVKEYDPDFIQESELARHLASEIGLETAEESLSSVAEYYDLRDDYGKSSLLGKLHKKLPNQRKRLKLYESLAKIERPLILISTAYDNLLERSFSAKGKRYVELSSIVSRRDEYDIGSVVIRYSDEPGKEDIIQEESVSNLGLLEKGYTLIYKIRGTCDGNDCKDNLMHSPRQDALTLMESDYFRFARYAERIIPGYIARQFRTRSFLFLGFRPSRWEDRLLVNALLEKRGNSSQDCLMIGESKNSFEEAYWDKRRVKRYHVKLCDLNDYLNPAEEEEVAL